MKWLLILAMSLGMVRSPGQFSETWSRDPAGKARGST
jgi:hypothetical protein